MRKLIAAAAVLAMTSAYAAEELKFGDLNYFLKQNQFNVSLDVSSTYYKESPAGTSTYETRGVLFETRYGYGISDRMNVYLGLDYAYDREVEDKKDDTNADFTQDGLANPLLAFNYRILNQNESHYNFDFGLVARVRVQDAEIGHSVGQRSKDGNFATGRHSLEANLRTGRKWNEANEWQVAAGVIYHTDGEDKVLNVNGQYKRDLDSSTDVYVRAAYQYRPVNEFMMAVSLQATRIGEADYKNKRTKAKSTAEDHVDLDFLYKAKYMITDYLIANFHFGTSRNAEYDVKTNGVDQEIRRRRENYYGVGVDFLF